MSIQSVMDERQFSEYIRMVSAVQSLGGTCWHEIVEAEDHWLFNIDDQRFSMWLVVFRDLCHLKFGTLESNAFRQGKSSLEFDLTDPAERRDVLRVLSNAFQLGYAVRTVGGRAVQVRVSRSQGAKPDRFTLNGGALLPSFVGQWYHASPPSA